MAAPTNAAYVKKALANSEPSTHGTKPTWAMFAAMSAYRGYSGHAFCNADPLLTQSGHGIIHETE